MSTAVVPFTAETAISFGVTDTEIDAVRERYAALDATTSAGYEEVRQAIAVVRTTRVNIEKRRVELKAEALAYGRQVDSEAKRWSALVESIEAPLVAKKQAVDDEKARVKAEAEAARLREVEERINAERAAEEARLKALRDAEDARLADERARLDAERAQLAEERARVDAAQAAARAEEETRLRVQREAERVEREATEARLKAEREALDKERRELQAQREAAERAEFERQTAIKAEAAAKAKIEADRLAAAELDARIAAAQPDAKKLQAYAEALLEVPVPAVRTAAAKRRLASALEQVRAATDGLGDVTRLAAAS